MQLHYLEQSNSTSCFISQQNLPPIPNFSYVHQLFSCDIPISGIVVVYIYTKSAEGLGSFSTMELILLTQNISGSITRFSCKDKQGDEEIAVEDSMSLVNVYADKDPDLINFVSYQNVVPEDWDIT